MQGRPVFESSSIFGLVPCLQSVGISSCLPVCCPSFSVGLGSFSQRPLVLAILHRCGWVLASSSGQTTLVFSRKSYNDLFPVWSIDDLWGFRVGGGVHDSYTFQYGLVGYFTSPGIDTIYKGPTAFTVSSERHWQAG